MLTSVETLYNKPITRAAGIPQPKLRCNLQHCYKNQVPQLAQQDGQPHRLEKCFLAKYDVLAKSNCQFYTYFCFASLHKINTYHL